MNRRPVVIITGGAKGIGRSTALKFATDAYNICVVDSDEAELQKTALELKELPCDFLTLHQDLQELHLLPQIIEVTLRKWSRVDVLINNAAWRTIETMRSITPENWEKTLKINLTAPAFLARYAAEAMESQNIAGVILNVSSVMSQRAGGISPAYILCKGALESLTYELAALYGPKQIRVITVRPGNIETDLSGDFTDRQGNNVSEEVSADMIDNTPLRRNGSPEEIANVLHWLSTKDASFITGTSITVDGGFLHNFNSYQMKGIQFPSEF